MNTKKHFIYLLAMALFFVAPTAFAQQSFEEVTWEELQARPYPQWFKDAKLGIFIHWGVYSVPSYGGAEFMPSGRYLVLEMATKTGSNL